MTIGQLWYTWSAKGAEGVNKLQVLAASGRLDDRAHPVTQAVLECCYRPTSDTLAWLQRGRVRIAFHRSPAGRDGRGRPGNFFVHALVGDADDLDTKVLARLWKAPLWVTRPPRDVPSKLDPFDSAADLNLAPPAHVDEDFVLEVLGGHLAAVRRYRQSAVECEHSILAACAARISELLPARFELVSFCSERADEQVDRYAIVPGPPPSGMFEQIASDSESLSAARMIMAAAQGDHRSEEIIDAIANNSVDLLAFSEQLQNWVIIERGGERTNRLTSIEVKFISSDRRLVEALLAGPGVFRLAASVAAGAPDIVGALATVDRSRLVQPVVSTLADLDPSVAVDRLKVLAPRAPDLAVAAVVQLIECWGTEEQLVQLDTTRRQSLLRLLDSEDGKHAKSIDVLLDTPTVRSIVSDETWSLTLRCRAVYLYAQAVPPFDLVNAFAGDRNLWHRVLTQPDRSSLKSIDAVLRSARPGLAYELARSAWELGHPRAEGWLLDTTLRLDKPSQFEPARGVLETSRGRKVRSEWGDILLETYFARCVARRESGEVLPLPGPVLELLLRIPHPSIAVDRWVAFFKHLQTLTSTGRPAQALPLALQTAHTGLDASERELALDLITETLATTVRSRFQWQTSLNLMADYAANGDSRTVLTRIRRIAVQPLRPHQGVLAAWTFAWVREGIAAERFPQRDVKRSMVWLESLINAEGWRLLPSELPASEVNHRPRGRFRKAARVLRSGVSRTRGKDVAS